MFVEAPLHSVRASGTIGQRLTFIHRGGRQTARFQRAQSDYDSAARSVARSNYRYAVQIWNSMTDEQRAVYNTRALSLHMSGYNLYVKEYLLTLPGGGALYGDHFYGDFFFGSP